MSSLPIREYEPRDEPAVLALLYETLGKGRAFDRTDLFWRWKHEQNVFGPSLMLVAADGDILGLRAFMRWRFAYGGGTFSAVRAVDTATHPAHRRRGVFAALTSAAVDRARREGMDLIFNTPNDVSLAGYLKLGWMHVGRPNLLIRVRHPLRIARTLVKQPLPQVTAPRVADLSLASVDDLLSSPVGVERLVQEDDRLRAGRIRTHRSVTFLRWRYARTPSVGYHAVWSESDPCTAALIVRRNVRRGLNELMVSELLLTSGGGVQVPALMRTVFGAADVDYAVAHAPTASPHWRALVRAGFLPVPFVGPHFTVRLLSDRPSPATRMVSWHLSLGDLEMF